MPGLPSQFRILFWDTDIEKLDKKNNKFYIIERALEYGDEAAYRWVFGNYSDEDIIEVIRRSRKISRRTALMMANFYAIPQEEIRCLKTVLNQVPYGF